MTGERFTGQSFTGHETAAMELALEHAARGVRGANPLVGAVILDGSGEVLSIGYHRGAGTAHAEADAIAQLLPTRPDLGGCTIVVTLEPCNHQGRTGPCAGAILDAGITEVIYAVGDSTAAASGGGAFLRGHGVRVRSGLLGSRALELNHRWFAAQAAGRPFTTLHIAQTVDGFIAAADGSSQWITGAPARADSHTIRARVDAILAGTGTVLTDDPRLTARDAAGSPAARQPLRVIMGHRTPPAGAKVFGDGNWVQYSTHDPAEVLDSLGRRGVGHLLVEGGATVAASFLAADLVDEIVLYLAPAFLGSGTRAMAELGIGTLADARRWRWDSAGGAPVVLGPDLRMALEPLPAAAVPPAQTPAALTPTTLTTEPLHDLLPGKAD